MQFRLRTRRYAPNFGLIPRWRLHADRKRVCTQAGTQRLARTGGLSVQIPLGRNVFYKRRIPARVIATHANLRPCRRLTGVFSLRGFPVRLAPVVVSRPEDIAHDTGGVHQPPLPHERMVQESPIIPLDVPMHPRGTVIWRQHGCLTLLGPTLAQAHRPAVAG